LDERSEGQNENRSPRGSDSGEAPAAPDPLHCPELLGALDSEFATISADTGRPSIPPERLLRALLLQAFYTIRSETQLMEQLNYNLLYRSHDAPPGLRDQSAKAQTNRGAVRLRPRPATQVGWGVGMISRTCSNKMTSAKPDAVTDLTSCATTDRHKLSAHLSAC
jgi:hypothetical protein